MYYEVMVVVILNVKSFICVFQICQDFSKCGPFKQLLLQVALSLCGILVLISVKETLCDVYIKNTGISLY